MRPYAGNGEIRMNLTVASYNIHKAEGLDRRVDLARIARVLGEIDADVVGIQEIYRPQAEALAAELGMTMEMGVTPSSHASRFTAPTPST